MQNRFRDLNAQLDEMNAKQQELMGHTIDADTTLKRLELDKEDKRLVQHFMEKVGLLEFSFKILFQAVEEENKKRNMSLDENQALHLRNQGYIDLLKHITNYFNPQTLPTQKKHIAELKVFAKLFEIVAEANEGFTKMIKSPEDFSKSQESLDKFRENIIDLQNFILDTDKRYNKINEKIPLSSKRWMNARLICKALKWAALCTTWAILITIPLMGPVLAGTLTSAALIFLFGTNVSSKSIKVIASDKSEKLEREKEKNDISDEAYEKYVETANKVYTLFNDEGQKQKRAPRDPGSPSQDDAVNPQSDYKTIHLKTTDDASVYRPLPVVPPRGKPRV